MSTTQALPHTAPSTHIALPCSDQFLDNLPVILHVLNQAVWGVFKRIIQIPFQTLAAFAPIAAMKAAMSNSELREITHESIDKGFYNSSPKKFDLGSLIQQLNQGEKQEKIPPKDLMHRRLDRLQELAKQMGISQKVEVYSSDQTTTIAGTIGSRLAFTAVPVIIDKDTFNLSDAQFDFIVSHELSHVALNHSFHFFLYSLAVLVADVAAAIFLTPFAIPLIEGASALGSNALHCQSEKDADMKAMKLINSNKGAVDFFKGMVAKQLKQRDENSILDQLFISPEGNNRLDTEHPRVSDRVAYCEAFQPSPIKV